ncbi:MAG TPA: 5-(carboxyamino)imidazole ribonucleotide synthase [Candidatus Eisenbacteria bacterium]|nr:5-(carboxyamino)imidazole ribonucleotide synthase [Candidatus Eisenbacteria bacterium]
MKSSSAGPILPGAVIGVLGSGQLGRMFAIAARQMGYRVHTLSPDSDTPTGQVADVEIDASYEDLDAIRAFAENVDVVTFEFENVPASSVEVAARYAPVRPSGCVLHTTQHRIREKSFLSAKGFPTTPTMAVHSAGELRTAIGRLGCPAILKTAGFGYDGKGQVKITDIAQIEDAFVATGAQELILEAYVDFALEFSVVAARGMDGAFTHWGVIENRHSHHILDVSSAPASVPDTVAQRAIEIARDLLTTLDVVGVLCIEFFLTRKGEILINELAPRPHNSGHLTIDASLTSQFEQQVRAVCGLPLGATEYLSAAAMANLLGDLWDNGEPNWPAACALPDVKLHLYGKIEPRPRRKMGHLTALAKTAEQAVERVLRAREALTKKDK